MENRIKVGQSCEVVEVLTDGEYTDKSLFKIGGHCTAQEIGLPDILCVFPNGENVINIKYGLTMKVSTEVKRIGKITITKVKQL